MSEVGFWGRECAEWEDYKTNNCKGEYVQMGLSTPNTSRGSYYLGTRDTKPFAMGKHHFFYNDPFVKTLYYRIVQGLTSIASFVSGK